LTDTFKKEIVQHITRKLADIQILRLIQTQPMWGYKIKNEVQERFGVKLRHGALYPMLNGLEQKGFITSEIQKQGGRTRKVYSITPKGNQYVEEYHSILKEQIQRQDMK
jgi:DNA-binding PadR family transcriptional regulator